MPTGAIQGFQHDGDELNVAQRETELQGYDVARRPLELVFFQSDTTCSAVSYCDSATPYTSRYSLRLSCETKTA
jgi:hypothetical protein